MVTQQLQVSILAAPLAAIDRRVLSQAWYCALRLPAAPVQNPHARMRRPAAQRLPASDPMRIHPKTPAARNATASQSVLEVRKAPSSGIEEARSFGRRSPFTLAEKIERAFGAATSQTKRATFSIGRGPARVHIILQTTGARPTLLAICQPQVRTIVAEALTQARASLARRGISLETKGVGLAICS